MTASRPLTVLCIACYFKGPEFIREAKRQGCRVFLITSQKLADEAWPRDCLDEWSNWKIGRSAFA